MTYDLPTMRPKFSPLHDDTRLLHASLLRTDAKPSTSNRSEKLDSAGERRMARENCRLASEIEKVKQSTKGEWA